MSARFRFSAAASCSTRAARHSAAVAASNMAAERLRGACSSSAAMVLADVLVIVSTGVDERGDLHGSDFFGERARIACWFAVVSAAVADTRGGEGGSIAGDDGHECVICMSEARNTTVLPCRHMCLCRDCAEILRHQASAKCPICRSAVTSVLCIRVEGKAKDGAAATDGAPRDG